MNYALLIASVAGLAFSVYAVRHHDWPNGAALRMLWCALKLTRCPHGAWAWLLLAPGDVRCLRCEKQRDCRIGKMRQA